jgi:iron complex transport system ATP-binding protein
MVEIYAVENLSFSYGKNEVLRNINAKIYKGEFVGIVGPNGSGKTTFLKLLAKILKGNKGNIFYKGRELKKIKNIDYAREVGYLPSEIKLTFDMKVKDFLILGRYPFIGRFKKEPEDVIYRTGEIFNIKNFFEKKMSQLSEGEKQRIYIAQLIVQNSETILLDEPTSHLDIGYQFGIMDILKALNNNGKTIICILHDLNLSACYCSKIILLNKGEVYKIGSPEEVLTYENIEVVYNTKVLVYKNPFTNKINVFGIPSSLL